MRLIAMLVAGWVLVASPLSLAQEKAPLGQDALVGKWLNPETNPRGPVRIEISKGDKGWSVERWVKTVVVEDGKTRNAEVSLGKATLSLLGERVDDKSLPYGFATEESKFAVTHSTFRVEKELLVVESFTLFTDKSGRSNYRTLAKYKKQ